MPVAPAVQEILRARFGHASLRPLQAEIVERIMEEGNALVVMPTGSGKSLCFQLPALALPGPGITLVFSPLIALMEDQVSALRAKGIRAQYVNSALTRAERERRYEAIGEGAYDLVYATPERMAKPEFVEALAKVEGGVKLLAIDEAHCISRWGHDLRPAYSQVGRFRRELGTPSTIALTATATAEVRGDIRAVLDLDETSMPLFAAPLDRPELALRAKQVFGDSQKIDAIRSVAERFEGTGIVYFALIKDLERFANELRRLIPERRVRIYHGKLAPEERKGMYDEFIESRADDRLLLLATNAFGMGVDKPDIRFIVHAQVPGSIEAYYQEVGRAGRDGAPSECVLLYDESDLAIQQTFTEWKNPSAQMLERAAQAAAQSLHADFDFDELQLDVVGKNRGNRTLEYVLIRLSDLGVIEPTGIEGRFRFVRRLRPEELEADAWAAKRRRDLERLLKMVHLARSDDLRAFVLDYFD